MIANNTQDRWEKRATVRSRPRAVYDVTESGYYYPLSRAPLSIHPLIVAKGEKAREFLLVQSLYKYSNDIATIETRVVNQAILKVASDQMPITFDNETKLNLYTIMVDEAYHAYVAFDAMMQIEKHTGIEALPLPKVIEIEKAIAKVKKILDEKYHNTFDLICVCMAENTLTQEIIMLKNDEKTHPFFQRLMKDHLDDEGRHAGMFKQLLAYIWSNIDEGHQCGIGPVIADFIVEYLDMEIQVDFDKKILTSIGFSDTDVNNIIVETYGSGKVTKDHPMLKNIISFLDQGGMINPLTLPGLKEKDLV